MTILKPDHKTHLGKFFQGDSIELLKVQLKPVYQGKVQLILTSPPFPLNNKKSYGNLNGREYKKWFVDLAPLFADLLTEDGSIVIEMGNAWKPRRPVQSMLHLESLMGFVKKETYWASLDSTIHLLQPIATSFACRMGDNTSNSLNG